MRRRTALLAVLFLAAAMPAAPAGAQTQTQAAAKYTVTYYYMPG